MSVELHAPDKPVALLRGGCSAVLAQQPEADKAWRLLEKLHKGRRKVLFAGGFQGCQAKGSAPGCLPFLVGEFFLSGMQKLRLAKEELFVAPQGLLVRLAGGTPCKGLVQTAHPGGCVPGGPGLHAVGAERCGRTELKPLAQTGCPGLFILLFQADKLAKCLALDVGPVFLLPDLHEFAGIGQAFEKGLAGEALFAILGLLPAAFPSLAGILCLAGTFLAGLFFHGKQSVVLG